MHKKSQHMSGETTSWVLVIVIIIILLFIFPNLLGEIKDKLFSFGRWVVKDPDRPKLTLEVPQDLKDKYNVFFDVLEKNKEGIESKECLLEYGGLSTPKRYSIELFEESGYSGWIFKLAGKEGGFATNGRTVGGLKPCIVNAENFYNQYLAENKKDTGQKYIEAGNLKIEDDEMKFKDKSYSFDQNYLFKSDGHICFFLIHSYGNSWGCDVGDYTLDNDCVKKIKGMFGECSIAGPPEKAEMEKLMERESSELIQLFQRVLDSKDDCFVKKMRFPDFDSFSNLIEIEISLGKEADTAEFYYNYPFGRKKSGSLTGFKHCDMERTMKSRQIQVGQDNSYYSPGGKVWARDYIEEGKINYKIKSISEGMGIESSSNPPSLNPYLTRGYSNQELYIFKQENVLCLARDDNFIPDHIKSNECVK